MARDLHDAVGHTLSVISVHGNVAAEAVRAYRSDVALMDIRMLVVHGLDAAAQIVADDAPEGIRVLILTAFDEDENVVVAIRAGAAGHLLKDTPSAEPRRAVRTVAAGGSLLSPSITRKVMQSLAREHRVPVDDARLRHLTGREREVVTELGRGLSDDETARRPFISPATARTYVSRLLAKLHARDRAQLVAIAYETGLVAPGRS